MEGTVKIVLGGMLGKLFGAEWNLFVSSPAEAIHAINVNLKGKLRDYLETKGRNKFYRICLGNKKNSLGEDELPNPSGRQDIYILPVIKGRNSGWGKVLAGIALIALTVTTFGAGGALAGGLWGVGAASWSAVGIGLGASLILGGISQLLTPAPNFNSNSEGDSRGSNIFQGNAATVTQGGAVGLTYGRMLVTPMPISLSITTYEQSAVNSMAPNEVITIISEGGIVNEIPVPPTQEDNLPPTQPT